MSRPKITRSQKEEIREYKKKFRHQRNKLEIFLKNYTHPQEVNDFKQTFKELHHLTLEQAVYGYLNQVDVVEDYLDADEAWMKMVEGKVIEVIIKKGNRKFCCITADSADNIWTLLPRNREHFYFALRVIGS